MRFSLLLLCLLLLLLLFQAYEKRQRGDQDEEAEDERGSHRAAVTKFINKVFLSQSLKLTHVSILPGATKRRTCISSTISMCKGGLRRVDDGKGGLKFGEESKGQVEEDR